MTQPSLPKEKVDKIVDFWNRLKKVLPNDHPIFDFQDEPVLRSRDMQDLVATTESLIEHLEDWKRGIRDWSEVEDVLNHARAELTLYKETT